MLSFIHVSNVLGTVNPVAELIDAAHAVGAKVLLDGAQSVPHMPVDVQALDVDFLVFSGHKMCGPTGIGVLYGKRDLLEAMPPFMGGGDMIKIGHDGDSTWADLPYKFEAGTPAIAEAIGLGAAVDYLTDVGMEWIHAHEQALVEYAYAAAEPGRGSAHSGSRPRAARRADLLYVGDIHAHDLSAVLDHDGIAVRAGHHCAQPIHDHYGIPASARASFYLYNTTSEIDQLSAGLEKAMRIFAF